MGFKQCSVYPAVETHIEDIFIAVPYIHSPQIPSCARAGRIRTGGYLGAAMSLTTYLRLTLLILAVKHPHVATPHTGIRYASPYRQDTM